MSSIPFARPVSIPAEFEAYHAGINACIKEQGMDYPVPPQVLKAKKEKLQVWWDNLPTAQTEDERQIIALIYKRLIWPQTHRARA